MASSIASMAARRAAAFNRLASPSSASQAASLVQRRGLAGAAGTNLSLAFKIDLD